MLRLVLLAFWVAMSVAQALQQCHRVASENQSDIIGFARVGEGRGAVRIPSGTMRFVETTCPEQLAGQTILFEPAKVGLPGGLLASTCLVQTTKGTAYIPVTNVSTNDILLYPQTGLGIVSGAQVVSLPVGVTEVIPTEVSVSSQAAAEAGPGVIDAVDLSALTEKEQMEVRVVLQKYENVFSQHEGDLGCTSLIAHGRDAFPLPRIEESLNSLAGARWFTTLDLASGYNQVPVQNSFLHTFWSL